MRLLFHLFGDRIWDAWDSLSRRGRYLVAAAVSLVALLLHMADVSARVTGSLWGASLSAVVMTFLRIGERTECPRDLD